MSMFRMALKTAINLVFLPLAIAADIVTFGGDSVTGGKSYTQKHFEIIKSDLDEEKKDE
jgi:hypothetical protein